MLRTSSQSLFAIPSNQAVVFQSIPTQNSNDGSVGMLTCESWIGDPVERGEVREACQHVNSSKLRPPGG